MRKIGAVAIRSSFVSCSPDTRNHCHDWLNCLNYTIETKPCLTRLAEKFFQERVCKICSRAECEYFKYFTRSPGSLLKQKKKKLHRQKIKKVGGLSAGKSSNFLPARVPLDFSETQWSNGSCISEKIVAFCNIQLKSSSLWEPPLKGFLNILANLPKFTPVPLVENQLELNWCTYHHRWEESDSKSGSSHKQAARRGSACILCRTGRTPWSQWKDRGSTWCHLLGFQGPCRSRCPGWPLGGRNISNVISCVSR